MGKLTTADVFTYLFAGIGIIAAFMFLPTVIVLIGVFSLGLTIVVGLADDNIPEWLAMVFVVIIFITGGIFLIVAAGTVLDYNKTLGVIVFLAYLLIWMGVLVRMKAHKDMKKEE